MSEETGTGLGEGAAGTGTTVPVETPGGDWREGLSAELRGDDHVKQYDSLEMFTKTAVSAQHMLGKKGVIPPSENASVEDYARYYEQLGRPTNVDKYSPADFKDVEWHEGVTRDEAGESAMLQELYDAGLSPYQAQRVYKRFADVNGDLAKQAVESHGENVQKLEQDLSAEFGMAKETRLEEANKAWVKILGSQERANELAGLRLPDGTLLGQQLDLIKGFAELGQHIDGETGMIGDKQPSFVTTPGQAAADLAALMGDKDFIEAWTTKGHPGHAAAQERYVAAHNAANGGA